MTEQMIEAAMKAMREEQRVNQNLELGFDDDVYDLAALTIAAIEPFIEGALKDRIEALQADKARLLRANHVLRLGLSGMVDSEDALKIADAMTRGDDIDWDQYPEATRKALVKPRVLFASLHNRVLTDAEIDQIIKERSDDRDTAR
jgi:hypothetical protein